jgi:hypothetical protein
MAYALVGTIGAVTTGTSGASITPAWGTSENRTANNLLICWVDSYAISTLPSAPTGWSIAKQVSSTAVTTASIFYKIAAGSDTAPTIGPVSGAILSGQLAEFSGNASSSPLDQTGSATTISTTPLVATTAGTDAAAGELVVVAMASRYSIAGTKTTTHTLNNGASATSTNNDATSTINHYNFAYGITTGNSSADSDSCAFTTTNSQAQALVIASFKLAAIALPPKAIRRILQARNRAATY